jgi:hypothetical protein
MQVFDLTELRGVGDEPVTFTEAAKAAVASLDPALAEPLPPDDVAERYQLLARHLRARSGREP